MTGALGFHRQQVFLFWISSIQLEISHSKPPTKQNVGVSPRNAEVSFVKARAAALAGRGGGWGGNGGAGWGWIWWMVM